MIFSSYNNIKISAIAAAVPEKVRKVDELKNEVDERVIRQFKKKTGIEAIHISENDYTAADYGISAVKAIEKVGKFSSEEIGVLLYITQTPDYRSPSTAFAIHSRLNLSKSCLAFDINLGCSGFVYGLNIAASLLNSSDASKAIVIIGDTLARGRINNTTSERESNTTLLFGDASAAILLEKKRNSDLSIGLMSDGTGFKALSCPYGAWKHPIGPEAVPGDDIAVFNFTISEIPEIISEFLSRTKSTINDYDSIVLHQANLMIIKQIAKKINVPMDIIPISLDRYGNTSGASVPLTIVDHYGDKNDGIVKLLTSGYGVGLSWGVASFEINNCDILPLVIGADKFNDEF